MPIPLYPMLSLSIVSHQASLNRFPHRLTTRVRIVLYLFFLLIFLQRSSVSFILRAIRCPIHSNLRIFITVTKSWDLYLVINSKLFLNLHCPFSFIGPYIFLSNLRDQFVLINSNHGQVREDLLLVINGVQIGTTCFKCRIAINIVPFLLSVIFIRIRAVIVKSQIYR